MANERFARIQLLLSDERFASLQNSTILVLGLGGVGSNCAETLARGGIGTLVLLDEDVVDISNINRQMLAYTSTIGRPKSEVMAEIVEDINPDCTTFPVQAHLNKDNIFYTLDSLPRPDYVVDCIDTVTQKLQIAAWCAAREVPLLSAMGAANKLDPSLFRFAEIHETTNCRLAREIRRLCRIQGIKGLEVLFSSETPTQITHVGSRITGAPMGSMSYVPPIMGKMLAGAVIRRLAGFEPVPSPPQQILSE